MMAFYHILGLLVFGVALPVLPVVWMVSEKRRANLLQRLGFFTGFTPKSDKKFRIWIHALSVGEVTSALPLVQGLAAARPGAELVFTASTRTGYQTACTLFRYGDAACPVSQIGYFPFDLWFSVKRILSKIDPDLVVLVETDLWPGFISMVEARGIPLMLTNARLSTSALKGYQRFGVLARPMLQRLSRVMVQTPEDARRFREAGVRQDRIVVTGNIKFDRPPLEFDGPQILGIRSGFGLRTGQQAWVAGSTHTGEEASVAKAFNRVKALVPELKLIIAPRDPGRSPGVVKALKEKGCKVACLSGDADKKMAADIILIDCLGVLVHAYAVADLAFVGGSLVAQGGHNPLEPAMFGTPVLFGPHMEDFHEISRMLVLAGAAEMVGTAEELSEAAERLLKNQQAMTKMGAAAKTVFFSNSGAVARTLEIMETIETLEFI